MLTLDLDRRRDRAIFCLLPHLLPDSLTRARRSKDKAAPYWTIIETNQACKGQGGITQNCCFRISRPVP
jgi:hypothetical protein